MKRQERILVATRGTSADDPAISRAFAVARRTGAQLVLLDALPNLPTGWEALLSSLEIDDAREEAERERRSELNEIAHALAAHGVRAEIEVRWGRPAMEIIHSVTEHHADLVVLEDDQTVGLNSLTDAVVRQCPVPVWAVKASPHVPPPRVLAAVDPTGRPGTLDERILAMASMAAEVVDGEVYVVHAWQPLQDELEWLPDGFRRRTQKAAVLEATRARHVRAVEELVKKNLPRLPSERVRIVERSAVAAVLETIDEIGADLVVFGTARIADYAGLILGKTADAIAERTPVSIVAVKPDGFITPVSR